MTIRPYKPADLAQIEPREYEREMREKSGQDYSETFMRGPAYTVFVDEKPVMAGGIVKLWEGVGEVWLFLSPWFDRHPKTGYRVIRSLLTSELMSQHFRRLQTPICASLPKNIRLVQHLGFECEGLMKRWGPEDCDYYCMAIVSKEGESVCLGPR